MSKLQLRGSGLAAAWAAIGCSIVIPNSVTSVGLEVFAGCTGLTSTTIGDWITEIVGKC